MRLIWVLGFCNLLASTAFSQTLDKKFEIGFHYAHIEIPDGVTKSNNGIGGRFVFNLRPWLAFEAEGNFFLQDTRFGSDIDGGTIGEGAFGVKAGLRKRRFGIFGKVRPGYITFGRVIKDFSPSNPCSAPVCISVSDNFTRPELDLGGVLEVYLNKRWTTRVDLSDGMIFYPDRKLAGPGVIFPKAFTAHDFRFSSGLTFRF